MDSKSLWIALASACVLAIGSTAFASSTASTSSGIQLAAAGDASGGTAAPEAASPNSPGAMDTAPTNQNPDTATDKSKKKDKNKTKSKKPSGADPNKQPEPSNPSVQPQQPYKQ